jgi:hypothetical protein
MSMAEINLIPEDYRGWLNRKVMARNHAGFFVGLLAFALIFGTVLAYAANRAESTVAQMTSRNDIAQQQRTQLEYLTEQLAEYERQWSLLRGLRAGAAAEDIFNIVDRALPGTDLWFIDWKFRKAGVVVDGQQRGVETGYFIITDPDQTGPANTDWQVETHMTIRGQALDHQALSTFVRALFSQPEVTDVNVQKTSLTDFANGRVVDFDLNVVLNSALEKS